MAKEQRKGEIAPPGSLQALVGALLFGSDHPLGVEEIKACLAEAGETEGEETPFAGVDRETIRETLRAIGKELRRAALGIELVETGGLFSLRTEAAAGRWLRRLLKAEKTVRLSGPSLETLAIIAYRQPISKAEIEAVRGVAADHIVRALQELDLVKTVGRSELPGRPYLYGTTPFFLEHFGLGALADLDRMDPTLQRSDYRTRLAIHTKTRDEKPVQQELAGFDGALVRRDSGE